jgi:hypothetical protein
MQCYGEARCQIGRSLSSDNSRAMCVCVICCYFAYFVVLSGGGTGCNSTHITRATEMNQANGRYLLNVNKPFANEWGSDSTLNIFVTSRSMCLMDVAGAFWFRDIHAESVGTLATKSKIERLNLHHIYTHTIHSRCASLLLLETVSLLLE